LLQNALQMQQNGPEIRSIIGCFDEPVREWSAVSIVDDCPFRYHVWRESFLNAVRKDQP